LFLFNTLNNWDFKFNVFHFYFNIVLTNELDKILRHIVVNIRFISPVTLLMAIFLSTVVIAKSVA